MEITRVFQSRELQKAKQSVFRFEKAIKKKDGKMYVTLKDIQK